MRIGIRFSDNDYSSLVRAFMHLYVLPTYYERIKADGSDVELVTDLTTDEIVNLFNKHVPYLRRYLAWHDQTWEAKPKISDMPIAEWHRLHFQIKPEHVYWDGATDALLNEWDAWNNFEFHWTDGDQVRTS